MSDLIDRQAAIDVRRYTFGNDEFSLEAAYHDCKLVFDGITDDDSFQEADTGLILYYANEIIYALHEALVGKDTNVLSSDCISRQAAIDALWKALFEYEDKAEKQFLESTELDVDDWIQHRIFVQNMSDIYRRVIIDLPSAQPEIIRCKDCDWWTKLEDSLQGRCARYGFYPTGYWYCAGAKRREDGLN